MPGNYSKIATVVTGQTITAAERNTEHDNHITYQTPAATDDYSTTITEMRTETDPYPSSVESQATSLAGELERIRYLIKQITGTTYWYQDPEAALTGYRLESADHTHQSTGLQAGTLDHGLALTGLTDDDHTQYALLLGRAGGQSLIGGTGIGDNLTLRSSSNTTKGKVVFGNAGTTAYDEVNERVGVGTASPRCKVNSVDSGAKPFGTAAQLNFIAAGSISIGEGGAIGFDYSSVNTNVPVALGYAVESQAGVTKGSLVFGTRSVTTDTSPTERWRITSDGHFLTGADNTYDIGASGATRPRTAYLGTSLNSPIVYGSEAASGTLSLRSTSNATKGKVLFGAAGTTAYDEVNERLGVGTASPEGVGHFMSSSSEAVLFLQAHGGGVPGVVSRSSRGTLASPLIVIDTNVVAEFRGEGWDGAAHIPAARINFVVDGTPGLSDMPGSITFGTTADGAAAVTNRWRIKSTGHILAEVDNTYDIGASGATRPRDVYYAGGLVGSLVLHRYYRGSTDLGSSSASILISEGFISSAVGTGSLSENADQRGSVTLSTGATSGGISRLFSVGSGSTSRAVALSTATWCFSARCNTAESGTTQKFVGVGLASTLTRAAMIAAGTGSGCFFRVDAAGVGVNIFAVTKTSASETTTDTGIADAAAYHRFEIEATTSSVVYKIDGSVVATHATNIPIVTMASGLFIENTEAIVKSMGVDYVEYLMPVTR